MGGWLNLQLPKPVTAANARTSVTLTYVEVRVMDGSEAGSVRMVKAVGHILSHTVDNCELLFMCY